MEIFRNYLDIPPAFRGASVALGNFDGVHLGHRAVIELARQQAQSGDRPRPFGVVTFEPHPRSYFAPAEPSFRLMNAVARASQLQELGLDAVFELNFDAHMARLTAQDFARQVLRDGLGVSHIVVGADFRFGKGREGTAQILTELGAELGFEVSVVRLEQIGEGAEGSVTPMAISSTQIRKALTEGNVELATQMLGHFHSIEGVVEHGEKRGRELGFRTANLALSGLKLPAFGVYATLIEIKSGRYQGRYQGVASVGVRPMFGKNSPNLEVHIFDFDGNIYGEMISVSMVAYLRGEENYGSLDALITQMHRDCEDAKHRLDAL